MARLPRICMKVGRVPEDWQEACVVSIYKRKGERCECKNFRGISLLSIPGNVFGKVGIERIRDVTEWRMGEERCGFRKGKGCVDQVFVVKLAMDKYCELHKCVYLAINYL